MLMLQALPPVERPAEAIVVTGKALPEAAAERAFQVEVLGTRQLADSPSHNLDTVLQQLPGLQLFRRSDAASGHPTSQGVTLRGLGGNAASRALLVLDGVPQADPFGGWVNWPAYDPTGLDEVRVIRGGGSVTHGPGALAGVIEMSSLTSESVNGALELGSREGVNGRLYAGAQLGGGLATVNAQAGRGRGFIPITADTRGPADRRAPYRQGSLRLRWIAPLASNIELQASGLGFFDRRDRGVPFTGNESRGADAALRLVGSGRWRWSATAYAQWREFQSSFASIDDERTVAARVSLQDSVPSRGYGASLAVLPPIGGGVELRLGADARSVSGESREFYAYADGQPTRRRLSGGESATYGLFGEAALARGPLTLSAGGRLDRWSIDKGKLIERLLAGGIPIRDDHFSNRSGWRPTARAGALLDLGHGLSLRSAAYLGWRMPTLNELFRPFRAGADATAANPLLKPERLSGIEAGARVRRGALEFDLTGFINRLSDAIANVTLGQGPATFPGVGFVAGAYRQRLNIDAVRVRGIEASLAAHHGPWSARLGASLIDPRVSASGPAAALDGLRPAQTPRLVLTGQLGWEDGARSAALFLRHVGAQFEDDLNTRRLRPATTVGAFAEWPLSPRLRLVARGENLLNEDVIAGIDDNGAVERATPRTLWLGLRLR